MPDLARLTVTSPPIVFRGTEAERPTALRDEGPLILLQLSDEAFGRMEHQIKGMPVLGVNPSLYLTGDHGEPHDYPDGRWPAHQGWMQFQGSTATLHATGTHVINISLDSAPNTLVIHRQQVDRRGLDPIGNEEFGAHGTRAFAPGDATLITEALKAMRLDLPKSFERDLRTGIAQATPRQGAPARPGESYADIPGQIYEVDYATRGRQRRKDI